MAAQRLTFLYPNLMRTARFCEPATIRSFHFSPSYNTRADFHTNCRLNQEAAYHRRYGPAAEPNLPPPSRPEDESDELDGDDSMTLENLSQTVPLDQLQPQLQAQAQVQAQAQAQHTQDLPQPLPESRDTGTFANTEQELNEDEDYTPSLEQQNAQPSSTDADTVPDTNQPPTSSSSNTSFEDVPHIPSTSKELMPLSPSAYYDRPHLRAGLYVHHFDTYSLVQDLAQGGFTEDQSVTIMKAVRALLHSNLDLAKDSLTSKSDIENESYLFKAACSELQSSLQASRNSEMQTQRASRTQLQHEADILSQRMSQELVGLKDDIQGMFNDHKMTTRELQRNIDTSIQELNYKITVSLNSDGKSEIEGLRWILTRRAAFAIAISAAMIIAFLKYSSVYHARKSEDALRPREPPAKEAAEFHAAHDATPHPPATVSEATVVSEPLG